MIWWKLRIGLQLSNETQTSYTPLKTAVTNSPGKINSASMKTTSFGLCIYR